MFTHITHGEGGNLKNISRQDWVQPQAEQVRYVLLYKPRHSRIKIFRIFLPPSSFRFRSCSWGKTVHIPHYNGWLQPKHLTSGS